MHQIDPSPYIDRVGPVGNSLGNKPTMAWLRVADLRVDPGYQREVLKRGTANIVKIAREFDWTKFGVVIVSPIGDGLYAIVDGQHRTIAAACRRIETVPCLSITANRGEQAAAFAAINGAVTQVSPLQIHQALLQAGDAQALELERTCKAVGVEICRYPVPANKMRVGQTLAIGTLKQMLSQMGSERLALALACIMAGGQQNVGCVNGSSISAMCNVIDAEPRWAENRPALLQAMRKFNFATESSLANVDRQRRRTGTVAKILAGRLFDYLDRELG